MTNRRSFLGVLLAVLAFPVDLLRKLTASEPVPEPYVCRIASQHGSFEIVRGSSVSFSGKPLELQGYNGRFQTWANRSPSEKHVAISFDWSDPDNLQVDCIVVIEPKPRGVMSTVVERSQDTC